LEIKNVGIKIMKLSSTRLALEAECKGSDASEKERLVFGSKERFGENLVPPFK